MLNLVISSRLCLTALAIFAAFNSFAQPNPTWLGRPFVKVVQTGDPIPGAAGSVFGEITHFTLHDGAIHIVAGESANKKGLFSWKEGQLTKLVYTDTLATTGSTFDTVHFTTDETEGALNFVGEVLFNRPGAVYGLFQWKDGVITKVFDTSTPLDGKTFSGFGYPVRAGHQIAWSSQFFESGSLKNGVFRWDGATLKTVVQSGDDLAGSLGAYVGQPSGTYQIAFDGESVGFVASDDFQGKGPTGIYRVSANGVMTKLIDGNDKHPSNRTYAQRRAKFVNVDLFGSASYFGVNNQVSAAGPDSVYVNDGAGVRYTGGTFDPATAQFGSDGTVEFVLTTVEQDGVTPILLDGEVWSRTEYVDGQGDDVAYLVVFPSGKRAIYAAIGATTSQPVATTILPPAFLNGNIVFRFGTVAAKSYRVEFKATLSEAWTSRAVLAGTGGEVEFSETTATSGYYRVVSLP